MTRTTRARCRLIVGFLLATLATTACGVRENAGDLRAQAAALRHETARLRREAGASREGLARMQAYEQSLVGVLRTYPESLEPLEIATVHFGPAELDLRPDRREALVRKGREIIQADNCGRIRVEGHDEADTTGRIAGPASLARAHAVAAALRSGGIAPERFDVIGLGDRLPIAAGNDEAAGAENRRVTVHLMLSRP